MDDFQIRLLSVMQNSSFIAAVARQDREILGIDYFGYNAGPQQYSTLSQIAVGASTTTLVPVQADSDFVLTYFSAAAIQANALVTNPLMTIQLTDTGTGKTFFSSSTLVGLISGNNGFPFVLPAPRVIAPNVNVKIDVNLIAGAGPMDLWLSFLGARVYYGGPNLTAGSRSGG